MPAITTSATHCARPAPRRRSALEIGCRAFVDEPTRTSTRRGGSVRAGSLTRLLAPLVVEAERRVRNRVEPLLRDRCAADGAGAVGAVVDPRERVVDLGDDVLGVLAERLVELAVDEIGRVIGEVLIAGGELISPPSSSAARSAAARRMRSRRLDQLGALERDRWS